jgi:hypothetical protein
LTTLALASLLIGAACGSYAESAPDAATGAGRTDGGDASSPPADGGSADVETTDASGGCVRVASEDMTAMPADWQSQTSANGQIGFVPHAGVKGGALRA